MSGISPGTMQLMNMGFGAATSALSGIAQWKEGSAQRDMFDRNADIELQKMEEERAISQQKYSQLSGRQRILYAKAGVDIGSGSPLLVMMDTAMEQEIADSRIEKAGKDRASMLRLYGDQAAYSGKQAGISTWLTGIGNVANQYYDYASANAKAPKAPKAPKK
jgi:hypothetical protein